MSGATEILPGLWIGDLVSSRDFNFLKEKQIHTVVNVCYTVADSQPPAKNVITVDLSNSVRLLEQIDTCCNKIRAHLAQTNLLVYCEDGYRFAPVIVISYLMKITHLKLTDIITGLKTKRGDIDIALRPHMVLLMSYQKLLKIR